MTIGHWTKVTENNGAPWRNIAILITIVALSEIAFREEQNYEFNFGDIRNEAAHLGGPSGSVPGLLEQVFSWLLADSDSERGIYPQCAWNASSMALAMRKPDPQKAA